MGQRSYTKEYRAGAVKLAEEVGASEAARQLKMPIDTLYTWITRAKNGDLPKSEVKPEPQNMISFAEQIKELKRENKMLKSENEQIKREMDILAGATAFFAVRRKK